MKERPILFSAPMVRALLAGTKTQTRRAVKITHRTPGLESCLEPPAGLKTRPGLAAELCPYGKPGDRLWVRETWQYYDWTEEGEPCIRFSADNATSWPEPGLDTWADRLVDVWEALSRSENYSIDNRARDRRWRPSIHMPRWASRILLEVTAIHVERLQDISEEDATAEGVDFAGHSPEILRDYWPDERFSMLWETINGDGSWNSNPWVWVVEFKRVQL